jgi:azurin
MKNLLKGLMIFTTFAVLSCGEKKEEKEKITIGNDANTENATTSKTSNADSNVVEISLTGNDQMQFNKNELRVKAGQTVKLTFRHVGKMEENVMGHNFVLLKQGTEINEFGQEAAKAKENEYIPQDTDKIIAHTDMIGGGETTTIEFEAPAAGTYDYICSFPGHYALMRGKFIVE